MRDWHLYVNRDTLQVCQVSPSFTEDETMYSMVITQELGIQFIEAPHLINDYVVFHDGDKLHFIKKDKAKQIFVPFFYTPAILVNGVDNPDILVSINKKSKEMTITMRQERKQYGLSLYSALSKDKQKAAFYISLRNDPNYLLETIQIDMVKLIHTGSVVTKFTHDITKTSIFTRKVFDSYGLEIV